MNDRDTVKQACKWNLQYMLVIGISKPVGQYVPYIHSKSNSVNSSRCSVRLATSHALAGGKGNRAHSQSSLKIVNVC